MNSLYDIKYYEKELSKYLVKDISDIVLTYIPIFYNNINNIFRRVYTRFIKKLDDNHIITGTYYYIQIWNLKNFVKIKELQHNTSYIREIEVIDNENIATAINAHQVKIINYKTEKEFYLSITAQYYYRYTITCLIKDNKTLFVGSSSGHILLWDVFKKELINKYIGHNTSVTKIERIDDSRIISASVDGEIRIWISKTGQCIKVLHYNFEITLLKRINNRYFAISRDFKDINIIDSKTFIIAKHHKHKFYTTTMLVYDDDTLIFLGKNDNLSSVNIWNYKTNTLKKVRFYSSNISSMILQNRNIICISDNNRFISIK